MSGGRASRPERSGAEPDVCRPVRLRTGEAERQRGSARCAGVAGFGPRDRRLDREREPLACSCLALLNIDPDSIPQRRSSCSLTLVGGSGSWTLDPGPWTLDPPTFETVAPHSARKHGSSNGRARCRPSKGARAGCLSGRRRGQPEERTDQTITKTGQWIEADMRDETPVDRHMPSAPGNLNGQALVSPYATSVPDSE
eukprot:3935191-Rhodomonas_salina.1